MKKKRVKGNNARQRTGNIGVWRLILRIANTSKYKETHLHTKRELYLIPRKV